MGYESLETKLIRKQNLYIRQMEEQLALYKEMNTAQEKLIENLNHALEVLSGEISRLELEKE